MLIYQDKHKICPAANTGADNSSGLSGLPGGRRDASLGSFNAISLGGYFWSTSVAVSPYVWFLTLDSYSADAYRQSTLITRGPFVV
jgi:hypothetical protein